MPAETREKGELKPSRYRVEKGLPTLPVKLVEKAWNKEYVDMEEFLPTPRSLRLADQARTSSSLQESLVGALSQFQALQHHQKSHRPGMDVLTWTKCFSLYIAVMSRKHPDMIPSMVAHMHTVMKLNQKVPKSMSWYEYDIGVRMEMAASEDRTWTCGDPWQYITCLPGLSGTHDPFDMAEGVVRGQQEPGANPSPDPTHPITTTPQPASLGKGRKMADESGRGSVKRIKRAGACRLYNKLPGGCPYGNILL